MPWSSALPMLDCKKSLGSTLTSTIRFLAGHGLDRGDHVLQLGNLTQSASGRHAIVLGHREDERALVRLETFEEGFELVGHGWAVAALK
jgi:hypothetical protein